MASHSRSPESTDSARGSRGRAAHLGPERRRPMVLDAAMRVLLERGYEGASMDSIAAAAGVSKPVVYDCYPGKEELFKALFQREEARVLGEIQAALPDPARDDPQTAFTEAFRAFLVAVAAYPEVYRLILLGEGGVSEGVARRIRRGRRQQVEGIAEALSRWPAARELGHDTRLAQLLGYVVVGLAEAGARALLAEGSDWTPEQLASQLGVLAAGALAAGTQQAA